MPTGNNFLSTYDPNVPSSSAAAEALLGMSGPNTAPGDIPFGAETSALEYSMLSFMLNGIDPTLLSGSTPPFDANGNPTSESSHPHMGIDYGSPHLTAPMGSYQNFPLAAAPTSAAEGPISSTAGAAPTSNRAVADQEPPSTMITSRPTSAALPMAAASPNGLQHVALNQAVNGAGPLAYQALEVPSPVSDKNKTTPPAHASGSIKPSEQDREQERAAQHQQEGSASDQVGSSIESALQRQHIPKVDQHWKQRIAKIYKEEVKPFPYTEGYHFLLKYVTEK
jgi:hypothetical protein